MQLSHDIPKEEISVAAYYVWEKQMSYETLCWFLAERQLFVIRNFTKPPREMIQQRAQQIYEKSPDYDFICWLIGELNLFIQKKTQKADVDTLFSE